MQSIGLVAALPAEARSLVRRRIGFGDVVHLPEGHWLTVSGAGPDHARQATSQLIDRGVAALVSWGCAAALDATFRPGDLVLPERILGADGVEYPVNAAWRDRLARAISPTLSAHFGTVAESPQIVADLSEKQALHATTGSVAVDMESAAIARMAAARGLPFLAVRTIADTASMSLPRAVAIAVDLRGAVHHWRLLWHLLAHPAEIPELARLGRAFAAAVATLQLARSLMGTDYLFPPSAGGQPSQP